jgi:hypothetical protein
LPNRDVHIPAGIFAPWLVLLAYVILNRGITPSPFVRYPWFIVALIMSFFSFVSERIPDAVEPPDSPQHRSIVHILGLLPTLYIIWFFLTNPTLPIIPTSYERLSGLLVISLLSGYASHFILDYNPF